MTRRLEQRTEGLGGGGSGRSRGCFGHAGVFK
jgi:hypothetical protein